MIISQKFFKLEVANTVCKIFTLKCFTYVKFPFPCEKFLSYSLLFCKRFDCNVVTFPLIQNGYVF